MTTYDDVITRSTAGALIPEDASKEIIAHMPEGSAIMRMARRLPNMSRGQLRMPVMSALPLAYFVEEAPSTSEANSYKQTADAEWENKYVYAKEIACIVPIAESVIDDVDYDIWGELRPFIVEALGKTFDAAVLYGTNAPSDWPDDILTDAAAASQTVELENGSTDIYDNIMGEDGVIALVEEDGFMVTGHIGALSLRGKLRGLRDENSQPIFTKSIQEKNQYALDGALIDFPLNGAVDATESLLISGQWDKLVYAVRQDVSYKVLDQAVITDPSDSNSIVYNLAQQDMVALRVTMRLGWQLPNPINRIQGTEASRYPFAVLTPSASA
jgi:HK97 family phage major capsid protein